MLVFRGVALLKKLMESIMTDIMTRFFGHKVLVGNSNSKILNPWGFLKIITLRQTKIAMEKSPSFNRQYGEISITWFTRVYVLCLSCCNTSQNWKNSIYHHATFIWLHFLMPSYSWQFSIFCSWQIWHKNLQSWT